jgi:hypothetical protein
MGWLTVPSLLDPRYDDRYHEAAAGTITAIAAASVLVILGLLLARAFGRLLRDPLGLLMGDAKFLPPSNWIRVRRDFTVSNQPSRGKHKSYLLLSGKDLLSYLSSRSIYLETLQSTRWRYSGNPASRKPSDKMVRYSGRWN